MAKQAVPVLIVGGGPVGLFASITLSRHGVRSLLVERHAGASSFPKGRAISIRTMELFRQAGLEDAVQAVAAPREESLHFYFGRTLTSDDFTRTTNLPDDRRAASSPTFTLMCSQDVLEPLLRKHAERHSEADVRFGTELVDFDQDDHGVDAHRCGCR